MNNVQLNDLKELAQTYPFTDRVKGSRVMITGATGLIGSTLVRCLMALDNDISITIPVRNRAKAIALYGSDASPLNIVKFDLIVYSTPLKEELD